MVRKGYSIPFKQLFFGEVAATNGVVFKIANTVSYCSTIFPRNEALYAPHVYKRKGEDLCCASARPHPKLAETEGTPGPALRPGVCSTNGSYFR